jgi:hypothetical protein
MFNKVLLIIIIFVELNSLRLWMECQKFADRFEFSSFDVFLKLKEAINNDIGYSTYLVRFFHNKIALTLNQLTIKYLYFWDINFGVLLFSFIGYFGIICGFWYLVESKLKLKWIILITLLLLPFIEVLKIFNPFQLRFILITAPYFIFSLYGLWQFMKFKGKKGGIFIIVLILMGIWYQLVLQKDIFQNCI